MRDLLREHILLVIHGFILLILLLGLVERTGTVYLGSMLIYIATLMISYAMLRKLLPSFPRVNASKLWPHSYLKWTVLCVTLFCAISHWYSIGMIPIIEALQEPDDLKIAAMRVEATSNAPAWLGYLANLLIKGLVPFSLLLLWKLDKRWFWTIAVLGSIYAASLLQKSFIITLFVPLWAAFLITAKWKHWLITSMAMLLLITAMVLVGDPDKWRAAPATSEASQIEQVKDEDVNEDGIVVAVLEDIGERVLLRPGWTVADWFTHIPNDIPYAHGGAVRPLALILGIPYVDLASSIYDLEYPENHAKGVKGTVGSAAFMYDYANFGWPGLVLGAVLMSILLVMLSRVFSSAWQWAFALCTFPMLALSATALSTVIVTHGLIITVLLYVFFAPKDATPV